MIGISLPSVCRELESGCTRGTMSPIMRYYIETDGRVYLVRRDDELDLPTAAEIPFPIAEVAPLATDIPVTFAVPQLPRFPRAWPNKDELASAAGVTPLVRAAVHASMPRVVMEGLCVQSGKILLVNASRGLTKGLWSLPGGFLRYGETPADGLVREVREELRVNAEITELVDVRAKVGVESRLHWVMLFYRITIDGTPDPDPDEIAAAQFFPLAQAQELLHGPLMRAVVAGLQ